MFFESSGTTDSINSRHFVNNKSWYIDNCVTGFSKFLGHPSQYCILALLPHYLERQNSSLIHMIQHFISLSKYESSDFFLYNHQELFELLTYNRAHQIPTLLFGVSFALKDFSEKFKLDFSELKIMETGGMKGRQEEITREDLHQILANAFHTQNIYSEYGMTELFSQAYSLEKGRFFPSPTMKIKIMEVNDPLTHEKLDKAGVINIIDLANVDTCSFIATEDLGIQHEDGSFEIIGRLDSTDLRGCNLMIF